MKPSSHDPLRLDVQALARDGAELAGQWPLTDLARLRDSAHPNVPLSADDSVSWQVRGEQRPDPGSPPQTWVHLRARAELSVECQRCLQPVGVTLDIDRHLRFVPGEEEAATLDLQLEEDVLELPRSLDLRQLVEDELLLALPLVPRHDVCPAPLAPAADDTPAGPGDDNPFAVLAALKKSGPSDTRH